MRAHSEDKPSAPQNRGTETLPPDSSRRKGADILSRVRIETPATQAGSSYALLPARLLCLPGGELLVLAVLLSMRRTNGTFLRPLTFGELCRSLGFCGKTLGAHVASLRAQWPCPSMRSSNRPLRRSPSEANGTLASAPTGQASRGAPHFGSMLPCGCSRMPGETSGCRAAISRARSGVQPARHGGFSAN